VATIAGVQNAVRIADGKTGGVASSPSGAGTFAVLHLGVSALKRGPEVKPGLLKPAARDSRPHAARREFDRIRIGLQDSPPCACTLKPTDGGKPHVESSERSVMPTANCAARAGRRTPLYRAYPIPNWGGAADDGALLQMLFLKVSRSLAGSHHPRTRYVPPQGPFYGFEPT